MEIENIKEIKKQLSLIETTLKDIKGKLMIELLDTMSENRSLKENYKEALVELYGEPLYDQDDNL